MIRTFSATVVSNSVPANAFAESWCPFALVNIWNHIPVSVRRYITYVQINTRERKRTFTTISDIWISLKTVQASAPVSNITFVGAPDSQAGAMATYTRIPRGVSFGLLACKIVNSPSDRG
jgi:hypothetical protein